MTLIIDDELMNVLVISEMLQNLNVQSISAFTGMQAIEIVKDRVNQILQGSNGLDKLVFKLILLDYSMPEMSGPEVAIAIRRIVD